MSDEPWVYEDGQPIEGWVTYSYHNDEHIVYGPFKTKEEADKWLKQLNCGSIRPLYTPFVYSRG